MNNELWYWVRPVDDPDALGDYGGYTFQTEDEARKFIEAEYEEHRRLKDKGYYESDDSPSLLQIETVKSINVEVVAAITENKS